MRKSSLSLALVSFVAVLFLYAPLGVIVVHSFLRQGTFSLHWHHQLLQDEVIFSSVKNTLTLAFCSTAISSVLGTGLGLAMARGGGRMQEASLSVAMLPVVIPDILMAAALLLFFSLWHDLVGGMGLGMPAMILGHVTFQIPFVAWVVRAGVSALDPALEQAARDLGATPKKAFWLVTLPLLKSSIFAGTLLAFTLSLDDFIISFFTSGPGSTTLPILIYSSVKRGISPEINALSTWIVTISVSAVVVLGVLSRRRPTTASPALSSRSA